MPVGDDGRWALGFVGCRSLQLVAAASQRGLRRGCSRNSTLRPAPVAAPPACQLPPPLQVEEVVESAVDTAHEVGDKAQTAAAIAKTTAGVTADATKRAVSQAATKASRALETDEQRNRWAWWGWVGMFGCRRPVLCMLRGVPYYAGAVLGG